MVASHPSYPMTSYIDDIFSNTNSTVPTAAPLPISLLPHCLSSYSYSLISLSSLYFTSTTFACSSPFHNTLLLIPYQNTFKCRQKKTLTISPRQTHPPVPHLTHLHYFIRYDLVSHGTKMDEEMMNDLLKYDHQDKGHCFHRSHFMKIQFKHTGSFRT